MPCLTESFMEIPKTIYFHMAACIQVVYVTGGEINIWLNQDSNPEPRNTVPAL